MPMIDVNVAEEAGMGYDPLPAAWYVVAAKEIKDTFTKTGDGKFLKVDFVVLEGEHKDKVVIERFNYKNPNEIAARIGRKALATWAKAVGLATVETDDLLRKPVLVKLGVTKGNDDYGPQNVIRNFKSIEEDDKEGYQSQSLEETDGVPF